VTATQSELDFSAAPRNLRAETDRWIEENPTAYALFLRFARQAAARGKPFGIKAIAERVRWECEFEYGGEVKINNNYPAYIARRLMVDVPECRDLIEVRQTRW